jgi:hypothetical protein
MGKGKPNDNMPFCRRTSTTEVLRDCMKVVELGLNGRKAILSTGSTTLARH